MKTCTMAYARDTGCRWAVPAKGEGQNNAHAHRKHTPSLAYLPLSASNRSSSPLPTPGYAPIHTHSYSRQSSHPPSCSHPRSYLPLPSPLRGFLDLFCRKGEPTDGAQYCDPATTKWDGTACVPCYDAFVKTCKMGGLGKNGGHKLCGRALVASPDTAACGDTPSTTTRTYYSFPTLPVVIALTLSLNALTGWTVAVNNLPFSHIRSSHPINITITVPPIPPTLPSPRTPNR